MILRLIGEWVASRHNPVTIRTVLVSLLFILPLFGLGAACLIGLPRGRKMGGVEPRCATCAYDVRGLPSLTCPECGSDLSRHGAVITAGRLPPGRPARLIAWILFCALAVLLPGMLAWSAVVEPALPRLRSSHSLVTLSSPSSRGYNSIAVRADTQGWAHDGDPDPLPTDLEIELTLYNGSVRALSIDPANLHFRDVSTPTNAMSSTPLDVQGLRNWMKDLGISGRADQLDKEAALVMVNLHQILSQPSVHQFVNNSEFSGSGLSSASSSSPITWVAWIPAAAAAIVWVVGVVKIMLRPSRVRVESPVE